MTAQELHNIRLQRLSCCIGRKAEELSDLLSLGQDKKIKCKTEELHLLNIYYEILKCHIPYDCFTENDIETCCNVIDTDNVLIPENLHVGYLGNVQNAIMTGINDEMALGSTFTATIRNCYTNSETVINVPYSTTSFVEIFDYINTYLIDNNFGYTFTYNNTTVPGHYTFIATVNDCSIYQSPGSLYWGFRLEGTIFIDVLLIGNGGPVNFSNCTVYEKGCFENCLSDEQAELVFEYICNTCD